MGGRGAIAALVGLLVAAAVAAGCGDDGGGTPDLRVEAPVVPVAAGANGVLYLDVINDGDGADRLTGVRTEVARVAELHETVAGDDGLSRMVPVDEIVVGAGETVSFAPSGLHVMLLDIADLVEGQAIEVVLDFAVSGPVTVEALVVSPADVAG